MKSDGLDVFDFFKDLQVFCIFLVLFQGQNTEKKGYDQ